MLNEAALSELLLASAAGAIMCLMFAGFLVAQLGPRRAAIYAVTLQCLALAPLLILPNFALALGAMLLFGAAGSLYNMAINSEGTVIEATGNRAIMSGLHGMFSLGGMVGAALTGAMLQAGVQPAMQLILICPAILTLATVTARTMLDSHPVADVGQAHFVLPRGPLLLIGVMIMAGMAAEGVMYDWSVLYLKQELGQPPGFAALAYTSFSGAMALTRFGGDGLRKYLSRRSLIGFGASFAALAMLTVLWFANSWAAIAGFACVGAGLATVVPMLFIAASKIPGTSPAAGIAAASAIGYGGFLLSPPLVGLIAHATSLSAALSVVVLAALILALGARYLSANIRV
jgi:predicted MFS family arabinose efflux permease